MSGYQVLVGGVRKGKGKEASGYFLHTCAEVVLGLRVERGVCESNWVCVIVGQQGCGSWQGVRTATEIRSTETMVEGCMRCGG